MKKPPMKQLNHHNQKRMKYISAFIRNYRLNMGMSQYELSECTNVHRNTLVRLEAGKNISLIKLFEILDAMNLEPHQLFLDLE
jgi:transcriptional regulator with XRE-family HTH domain